MTRRLLFLHSSLFLLSVGGAIAPAQTAGVNPAGIAIRSLPTFVPLPATLRTIVSDTLRIEARLPSALEITIDTLRWGPDRVVTQGVATDPDSGLSYVIRRIDFSRFDRVQDQSTLFAREIMMMMSGEERVESQREMMHNGDPALEVEIVPSKVEAVRRVRMVLHGSHLYQFIVEMPRSSAYSARTEEIFSSIRLTAPKGFDLYSSKLQSIIAAIDGRDEALRGEALRALDNVSFGLEKQELILDILKRPRPDDDFVDGSVRLLLFSGLGETIDSTSLPALRRIYPTLEKSPRLRTEFRNLLATINSTESVRWLGDLLLAEKVIPDRFPSSMILRLEVDISTSRLLLPKILPLLEHPVYREGLFRYLGVALEQEAVEPSAIVPHRRRIIEAIESSVAEADNDRMQLWAAVAGILVLQKLPSDDATITLLRSLTGSDQSLLRFAAMLSLLHLGQPVDDTTITSIAAIPLYRLELHRELDKMGRADLFPRRYLTQRAISEAALVHYLADRDDREPDSIVLAATREVTVDGGRRRAYIFKILYRSADAEGGLDVERWTAGLGSLQPIDPKEIDFTDAHAISHGRPIGEMTIDWHLKEMLGDGW